MRQIGHLDNEKQARIFQDYLYSREIENEVEADGGRWSVWVLEEDRVDEAVAQLEEFRRAPGDARYAKAVRVAREKREQVEAETEAARKRFFDRDSIFPDRMGLGLVTVVLIGLSLLATGVTSFGKSEVFPGWLAFAPFRVEDGLVYYPKARQAMLSWEGWRWVTPIFVHMSFTHALFNMVMLGDLGGRMESRLGRGWFLALVVVLAVPSNAAQFLWSGPAFGGMSGVLYGLFGYCWMRGRLDPYSGFEMNPTSVGIMMAWYFLCLFGVIQNVANVVHTVGLALGMIGGLAGAVFTRR